MTHINSHKFLQNKSKDAFPILYELLGKNGPLRMPQQTEGTLFSFIAKTIIGQQLSKAAANSIWANIHHICSDGDENLKIFIRNSSTESIKQLGTSGNKAKALINLCDLFDENPNIEEQYKRLNHESLALSIKSIWGLGDWSAEMISLFYFNNEDVWSLKDVSLCRGLKKICNDDHLSEQQAVLITNHFKPYRSYLALHLWRGLDSKNL